MKTFEELDLIPAVQRALADEDYTTPTPIQAKTIPPAIEGRDILGCAQTGTGKTAAFALPILNQLGKQKRKGLPNSPQVLVLAPTRELAIQIGQSFSTYGKQLRLRHVLVYGGVKQGNQVRALNRGVHILVATPGRLIDLMNQGHIHLDHLEVFVLDEADRMLDMGFLPDLKRIISQLPEKRQSLFFSATMPPKITQLSQSLLKKPFNVDVTPRTTSVKRIEQGIHFVERAGKMALLRDIVTGDDVERVIVFTRTKRGANVVAEKLERSGTQAMAIHGNKSQNARQRALEAFREQKIRVLVATDVAARGIDIDGVTHVVNYDLPMEPEAYVHRIGRTGRAGAEGIALSFCSGAEVQDLDAIEKLIGQKVPVISGIRPAASQERRPGPGSQGRNRGGGRRRGGSGSGQKRPASRGARSSSGNAGNAGKPKSRRNRRRSQNTGQRSGQST